MSRLYLLEAECMCSSAVRRSSLCFSLCRTCQCGSFSLGIMHSLSLSLCLFSTSPLSDHKNPALFRNHVGGRSLRKNEIRVGFHRFQGDIIPEPITLFSTSPLSFLLPSKSRFCVEQVLGPFHSSVVFTSDPLCGWMYKKSAHQGVLVRSSKCGSNLHSFHENTPTAADATH